MHYSSKYLGRFRLLTLKWPEKRSKVIFGHPKWRHFVQKKNKKIKFRMDLKWPEMPSKVNFGHPKWPIDLKWPEMRSK